MSKHRNINVRLTEEQGARLDQARTALPYSVSITEIIGRGIELAAGELEEMAKARRAINEDEDEDEDEEVRRTRQ